MVDEGSVPDIISAILFGDVMVIKKNYTQIDHPIRENEPMFKIID